MKHSAMTSGRFFSLPRTECVWQDGGVKKPIVYARAAMFESRAWMRRLAPIRPVTLTNTKQHSQNGKDTFVCTTNTARVERRVPKAVMFSGVVVRLKHFVDMKTEQRCFTNSPNHKACLQRNYSARLRRPAPSPNAPGFILSARFSLRCSGKKKTPTLTGMRVENEKSRSR